jgi:hypothetical protein
MGTRSLAQPTSHSLALVAKAACFAMALVAKGGGSFLVNAHFLPLMKYFPNHQNVENNRGMAVVQATANIEGGPE